MSDGLDVGDLGGDLLDVAQDSFNTLGDTTAQIHGVQTSINRLATLTDDGTSENGGGGGTISSDIVGLGGNLLDELGTQVHVLVGEINLLGDGDTILGDLGATIGLLDNDVATLGSKSGGDRVSEGVNTLQHEVPGLRSEADVTTISHMTDLSRVSGNSGGKSIASGSAPQHSRRGRQHVEQVNELENEQMYQKKKKRGSACRQIPRSRNFEENTPKHKFLRRVHTHRRKRRFFFSRHSNLYGTFEEFRPPFFCAFRKKKKFRKWKILFGIPEIAKKWILWGSNLGSLFFELISVIFDFIIVCNYDINIFENHPKSRFSFWVGWKRFVCV